MRILLFFAACLSLTLPLLADNWPSWRGPKGDGTTAETELPLKWSATEGVRWKIALPERGNGSPIVWGDRIFLTQSAGTKRTLLCLDRKDGHTVWQAGPEWVEKAATHGDNPYCSASPVCDGERVIAWFGSAGLWCWTMDGKEQWHVDLGLQNHQWGYAASPVLHGELCLLNFGPGARSFIVAVDKRTGKEAWRFNVPDPVVKEGPGGGPGFTGSWNTGTIADMGGRKEYIVGLPGAVFGLDPQTGRELWHCNGLNALTYADPIIGDGVIAGFGGYGGLSIGVKAGGSGDITTTHRLWQEKKNPQRIGSSAVLGKHAYLIGEPGVVQCIELTTGKTLWQERMHTPAGRASTWSSLIRSGDRIFAVTQDSDVVIFKASPEKYEQLAVNSLGDGHTNATLAISDGQIFLRTDRSLWCIGK